MISVRRDGDIAIVEFDRPSARNALSADGWDQLADTVAIEAIGDAAVVILSSAVRGIFSAGADLAMLDDLRDDHAARPAFRARMRAAIDGIAALPMPTIAAVDGGCYGAAVALVLACDICVAGDGAAFATTPAKLGIGYPGADVARLADRVGHGQAARMLFSADAIDADEAVGIGLAHLRAPVAIDAAMALAGRIATNARGAVRLLKIILADPAASDAAFDAAFGGAEFADRIAAFRSRRR